MMLGSLDRFVEHRSIVGMNSLDEFFGSGETIPWIKTQNAVAFLRPMPDVAVETPGPTARVAESLRLCQIGLALTQLLLRPLALSDVDYSSCVFDEFARGTENRMTNAVNVPDGATGMHNAIIQFLV